MQHHLKYKSTESSALQVRHILELSQYCGGKELGPLKLLGVSPDCSITLMDSRVRDMVQE